LHGWFKYAFVYCETHDTDGLAKARSQGLAHSQSPSPNALLAWTLSAIRRKRPQKAPQGPLKEPNVSRRAFKFCEVVVVDDQQITGSLIASSEDSTEECWGLRCDEFQFSSQVIASSWYCTSWSGHTGRLSACLLHVWPSLFLSRREGKYCKPFALA
jgi:hypothetical protein